MHPFAFLHEIIDGDCVQHPLNPGGFGVGVTFNRKNICIIACCDEDLRMDLIQSVERQEGGLLLQQGDSDKSVK